MSQAARKTKSARAVLKAALPEGIKISKRLTPAEVRLAQEIEFITIVQKLTPAQRKQLLCEMEAVVQTRA